MWGTNIRSCGISTWEPAAAESLGRAASIRGWWSVAARKLVRVVDQLDGLGAIPGADRGWVATADGGLSTPNDPNNFVDALKKVPLFGAKLQCASCHDPHDDSNPSFLVIDNTGSDLCQTCHTK